MSRIPKPMERYRHFKGGCYQVVTLATKEDTGEELVIYQALYGEGKVYARDLSSFLSEVDHEKYPDVRQKYRFERIVPGEDNLPDDSETGRRPLDPEEKEPEEAGQELSGEAMKEAGKQEKTDLRNAFEGIETESAQKEEDPELSGEADLKKDCRKEPEREEEGTPDEMQETALDPYLEKFLDARTTGERLTALDEMRGHVTDEMIDTMALASGVEVGPGATSMRYEDLRDCLATIEKYELERGRLRG